MLVRPPQWRVAVCMRECGAASDEGLVQLSLGDDARQRKPITNREAVSNKSGELLGDTGARMTPYNVVPRTEVQVKQARDEDANNHVRE